MSPQLLQKLAWVVLGVGVLALVTYLGALVWSGYLFRIRPFSLANARDMGGFFAAVGVFFSLGSTLLVLANLKMAEDTSNANKLLARKAQFEKIFFDLLAMHDRTTRGIDCKVAEQYHPLIDDCRTKMEPDDDLPGKGKEFFDHIAYRVAHEYLHTVPKGRDALTHIYGKYYSTHISELGHCYRSLYHIVKFIAKDSYLNEATKDQTLLQRADYYGILRSQLTNGELVCLAMNGFMDIGVHFKKLIDDTQLLKNIGFEMSMPFEFEPCVPDPLLFVEQYDHLSTVHQDQKVSSSCRLELPEGKSSPFEQGLELAIIEKGREQPRPVKVLAVENGPTPRWVHVQYEKTDPSTTTEEVGLVGWMNREAVQVRTRRIWMQPVKLKDKDGNEHWFV